MGKKRRIVVDFEELGRLGGHARAQSTTPEERRAAAKTAIAARWEKYYRDNPEKLKAKQERDARKKKTTARQRRVA